MAEKNLRLIHRAAVKACRRFPDLDMEDCVSRASLTFVECMSTYDPSRGSVASYVMAAMDKQLWEMGCRTANENMFAVPLTTSIPDEEPTHHERPAGWETLTGTERKMVEFVYGLTGREPERKHRRFLIVRAADRLGIPRKHARTVLHNAICKLRRAVDRSES